MWFIGQVFWVCGSLGRYFACGVCVCSSHVSIPEEFFLYLASVNIFSSYIFCMCLVAFYFSFWFFLFCYVLFCFLSIGVTFLASLSRSCGTDYCEEFFVLCFIVLSSLLGLYVVAFCYQEIWWLQICVWGVAEIKQCNAVCIDRLLVNWEF